jgi:type I restriction enzyme S subunit
MSQLIGWPIVRLQELAANKKNSIVGGPFGSNLVSSDYVDAGVPVVRGVNLPKDTRFSFENLAFVTESKADSLKPNLASAGDLVFTQRGTLGQVGIIPNSKDYKRFLISQSQMKMTVDLTKAEPIYLYYFFRLNSTVNYIENHALQSGVPHINLGILRKFEVITPPLQVQKKIAAILSAYDDLIENNKRRIALLEKMAEEIYREWFVRFRFPGYQTAEFEKGIPKDWLQGSLGDITNMLMGQSPKSEFYNDSGNGLPFHQGVGSYGDRFPKNETFCSVDGRTAKEGDILFSVRAPVGRLNIANTKMIIGRGLAAISHKKGFNSYLFYLLKVAFSNEDIIGNGSIFNSVGKDELNGFKLLMPPDVLVKEFDQKISVIDKQISLLIQSVENLTQTKQMLLPRLISGKLSVQDLDIQFPPGIQEDSAA